MTNIKHHPAVSLIASKGIQAWLSSIRSGADGISALRACLAAAQASAQQSIWIHLCPDERFEEQLHTLSVRLQEPHTQADLLRRYPLLGVPFAVKDNIDIAGEPTTAGCPAFAHVATDNATVVHKLLQAGAVWIGKTNMDQFATGLVGTRSPHGKPASVFDDSRISGGSSSGSAVAVARGQVLFALGTDTAGSGRIPAAFNGLVGLKPTPGRVSNAGVLPACRTLDCVSVFAHAVEDAATVLAVIEGPDPKDSYSNFKPGPAAKPAVLPAALAIATAQTQNQAQSQPQKQRLGIPREPLLDETVAYPAAWKLALAHAQSLGFELVPLDFGPLHEVAAMLYDGPWVAERYSVLQRLLREQPGAVDEVVRQVVSRAQQFSATDTFEAFYRLQAARQPLAALWQQCDALLVPTSPAHPSFAEVEAEPLRSNVQLGHYTNFVNLLGWCALAVPAGRTPTGLPFGVTFIGEGQHDVRLLDLGQRWTSGSDAANSTASASHRGAPAHAAAHAAAAAAPPAPAPALAPATTPTLTLAVVGAHLSGLPLNGQLLERGAWWIESTHTAASYRLFALPGTQPPKPGLVRVPQHDQEQGHAIAVELWAMPQEAVGSFLALIPAPLGLGSLQLQDGRFVHGFLCESHALQGATDISAHGGWRAYLASLNGTPQVAAQASPRSTATP